MSLATIDDRMDFLFQGQECGLWYGATERKWEFEPLAIRRFFRRFGYKADCGDCGSGTWHSSDRGAPKHLALQFIRNPRDPLELAEERRWNTMVAPTVRYAGQARDGFGRFATRRGYVWRSDFDEFMDWYEGHLADRSVLLLSSTKGDCTEAGS